MQQRLILASGSPRRKELLENVNISFDVVVSEVEEIIDPTLPPQEIVKSLAFQKAHDVSVRYPDAVVLGSDTVVVYQDQILGKPENEEDSYRMLKMLSGQTHHVVTGVAIISSDKVSTFYEKTEVTFWELSDQEIKSYIASGEPTDKAGSYGIQQLGSSLVKRITGDYFTVVGLPISRTVRELRNFGFTY